MWQNHQMDNAALKTSEALTLWRSERGLVEISKDALVLGIKEGEKQKGYVFHGKGKLLLDTIVETKEGAIGRSVERELDQPFLMLENSNEIQQHLSVANNEDLARMGYTEQKDFGAKARQLFDRFLERQRIRGGWCCSTSEDVIFAFSNESGKADVLVLNGSGIIYKTMNMVFVSDKDKVVMKSPEQTILSNNGKSFIIKC